MADPRRDPPRDDDPTRLIRFLLHHTANGVAAGWTAMLALIWLDVGGLGTLLQGSAVRELATAMMAGGFALIFGFVGMAWGVLVILPESGD